MWLQYGGNWGAAGGGGCPVEYQGTAYVAEQPWDISSLQACTPGSTCPVSSTFTDEHFVSSHRKLSLLVMYRSSLTDCVIADGAPGLCLYYDSDPEQRCARPGKSFSPNPQLFLT